MILFVGWAITLLVWFVILILPCLCLYISYYGKEKRNILLHCIILIFLSALNAIVSFFVFEYMIFGLRDLLVWLIIFYAFWIIISHSIRKTKFFEVFWFSIGGINCAAITIYTLYECS